jgi:hypothetical protein
MPLLQTFEPANPHGIEWDHSYTLETAEEKLLNDLFLKNVTAETIKEVEQSTRGQDTSAKWHEMWAWRITASIFYTVSRNTHVGKKAIVEKIISPKLVHTRAVTHGKIQEPIAIQKYEAIYGVDVQKCGLFISQEYPFLAASWWVTRWGDSDWSEVPICCTV